jgi:hypothetical protein
MTQEVMKHEFGKHPKYNWDNVRMSKAIERFRKVYAMELSFVVFTEYGLSELLSEEGVLNVEEWKKRCEKDYLLFELMLRGMPIKGADYRQFQIHSIRRMRLGSGEWEENMRGSMEKMGAGMMLGVTVIDENGKPLSGIGSEIYGANEEMIMMHKMMKGDTKKMMEWFDERVEGGSGLAEN